MEFKKAGKYSIGILLVLGVLGLLIRLIDGNYSTGTLVPLSHEFGRINLGRGVLIAWETFWLSVIAVFFFWVAKQAGTKKTEEQEEKLENFEPKLFKAVVALLVVAAIATLILPALIGPGLPHYNTNDPVDQVVEVNANRFSFSMNDTTCTPSETAGDCISLETGVKYGFLLESTDTTHGFTIYDEDRTLLIQAQIVPGYVTQLVFTFDDPGTYAVRCSEFCGAGHQSMLASFTVTAGGN